MLHSVALDTAASSYGSERASVDGFKLVRLLLRRREEETVMFYRAICFLFWPVVAGMRGLCALGITSARMGQLLCLLGRDAWRGVSTGELQQQTSSTAVFIGACIFLVCLCMAAWSRKRCARAAWMRRSSCIPALGHCQYQHFCCTSCVV